MGNYWGSALVISMLVHILIFTGIPYSNIFRKGHSLIKKEKKTKEIKMVPEEIEKITKEQIQNLEEKPLPYINIKNTLSTLIKSDNFSPLKKPQIFEKNVNVKEIIFTEFPQDNNKELKKNLAYMSYYHLIRDKISLNAHRNYDGKNKGEVFIRFCVSRDGTLKNVELYSKSVSNKNLKNIVLKSIKDAAPFPPFPPELSRHSSIPFSVSIYFKNN